MKLTFRGFFEKKQEVLKTNPNEVIGEYINFSKFTLFPIPVKIKLEPNGKMPFKAHDTDAGFDLYVNVYSDKTENVENLGNTKTIRIPSHSTVKVSVGFSTEIPEGYVGHIWARSGLSSKKGLRPCNCVGVVDSDYRNTWIVALHNDSEEIQYIEHGERIAQMTIDPVFSVDLIEVDKLNETERGMGGFGSSGEK